MPKFKIQINYFASTEKLSPKFIIISAKDPDEAEERASRNADSVLDVSRNQYPDLDYITKFISEV